METLCTVPLARLWVPYHVRACAHQLHWRLLSHHGVSVGQRTLLGRGFYCAYEDSEQIEWPQDFWASGRRLGLSRSAQSTSRSVYSTQLTRRASRLSSLLVAPASQWATCSEGVLGARVGALLGLNAQSLRLDHCSLPSEQLHAGSPACDPGMRPRGYLYPPAHISSQATHGLRQLTIQQPDTRRARARAAAAQRQRR